MKIMRFYTNDSLSNNSYRFYDWKFYIENLDSNKNKVQFFYQERYDWFKYQTILKRATKAISPGFKIGIVNNRNLKLNYSLAYRTLQILDTSLTNILPENSLASRLNYHLKLLKGGINSNSFSRIRFRLRITKRIHLCMRFQLVKEIILGMIIS